MRTRGSSSSVPLTSRNNEDWLVRWARTPNAFQTSRFMIASSAVGVSRVRYSSGASSTGVRVERIELGGGIGHLAVEHGRVPGEAGVGRLDRLVGLQVEGPVEVEGRRLEPVALPE